MKLAFLRGASVAAVTIAALGATQAMAQAAGGQPAAGETAPGAAEVTVVATKRNESVEKVPVAVTAFSNQQRTMLGIKSIQDMSDFTPGLAYYGIANWPYLLGIGRNTDNLATQRLPSRLTSTKCLHWGERLNDPARGQPRQNRWLSG